MTTVVDGADAARPAWSSRGLVRLMVLTDVGFVLYWAVTALHALPRAWLFKDYDNAVLQSWNWSFLALDLVVSITGARAYLSLRRSRPDAVIWTVVSLVATSTSGLMAISFWLIRRDFDVGWWVPNLFLLLYPIPYLRKILMAQ